MEVTRGWPLNKFHMGLLRRARRFFSGPDKESSRERRKLKRIACHQQFLGTRGKESFPLTVIDVGFGGFKMVSDRHPGERGELLHLRRVSTDYQRHLGGVYTTGIMVRVAWVKTLGDGGYEAGLHLPQAPGTMRISWFKELLSELGMDEKEVFSKRNSRRHRCQLPATLEQGSMPACEGLVLDLSQGGALFGCARAVAMGENVKLSVVWGRQTLDAEAVVLGVRQNSTGGGGGRWLHSLRFEPLEKKAEVVLSGWIEELARNDD